MKPKKKAKHHAKRHSAASPVAVQRSYEVINPPQAPTKESKTYTPMETGQPNHDQVPDYNNPQAVQGGLGPLNQEGEGERQNDQLAELEQIEPDINHERK